MMPRWERTIFRVAAIVSALFMVVDGLGWALGLEPPHQSWGDVLTADAFVVTVPTLLGWIVPCLSA